MSLLVIAVCGFLAAAVGTLGGLGGAVLLVPVLVLGGLEPNAAVPLGLMTVTAGSLAAAADQIESGLVHHRLGITIETAASGGAVAGALIASAASADALRWILAGAAVVAMGFILVRGGGEVAAPPAFAAESPGEWPGTLAGSVHDGGVAIAYEAARVPTGVVLAGGAGFVAGISGTSGGYLKTPILTSWMQVPAKVAAATVTFTVGVTAATALLVFLTAGHVDLRQGAVVVAGALPGGRLGASLQRRVPARTVQWALGAGLGVIAALLVVTR